MQTEAAIKGRLDKDPWSVDLWESYVDLIAPQSAPAGPNVAKKRAVFEQLVTKFPTAASYWQRYAELEMSAGNQSQVKAVFNRCLLSCPSVPLWTCYLTFIKKVNEAKGVEGLAEVRKAYEFTLDRTGSLVGAGPLWQEYIHFLQAPKPGTPAHQALFAQPGHANSPQDDTHRATVLRRAYQRAVSVPTSSLDALWRAYEGFESNSNNSNKQFTQRVLAEHRPRYQAARTALNELLRRTAQITTKALATPPGTGGGTQQKQAQLWQEWLAWEKSNPQRLDGPALSARVALAYDEALTILYHYPEVWYMYSRWHALEGGGGPAAAAQVLAKACKALPACSMLHFAAADLEEACDDHAAAALVYASFADQLLPEPDESGEIPSVQMELTSEEGSLFWIRYMRYLRRTNQMAASRRLFLRARKWPPCGWQVFAASAQLEWLSERSDKVPRNIYELGFKAFADQPGFISAYVTFLISQGDVDNARQLFERALAQPGPPLAIWDAYLAFESEHGSLATASGIEQRRREAAGEASDTVKDAVHVLMLQQREMDLWPCSEQQSQHVQRVLGLAPLLPEDPPEAKPHPRKGPAGKATQQPQSQAPAANALHAGPGASSTATSRQPPRPAHAAGAAPLAQHYPPRGQPGMPVAAMPVAQARPPVAFRMELPPVLNALLAGLGPLQAHDKSPAPVDTVMDVLMRTDFSADALAAAHSDPAAALFPGMLATLAHAGGGNLQLLGQKRSFELGPAQMGAPHLKQQRV